MSPGAPPPRAVLWDADGVLQRVPGGGEESMRPAVTGLVDDVDAFLEEAVRRERPALTGDASWPAVLPGLLGRWGIGSCYQQILRTWLTVEPLPETRALVRELRSAGVACYLATNQAAERAALMRRELGYDELLDGAFYSFELGSAKPDPAYFRAVLAALGRAPGEVLLVDDGPANVASARSLGMVAHLWCWRDGVDALRGLLAAQLALA